MKIVITGDTHVPHRATELPRTLLEAAGEADAVIHTGDFNSIDSYHAFDEQCRRLLAVRGNRDEGALADILSKKLEFEMAGVRFVILHGDAYGRPRPSRLAREFAAEADVIVYGHLHHPYIVPFRECTVINPGSPVEPRGSAAVYARATIQEGTINASIVPLNDA